MVRVDKLEVTDWNATDGQCPSGSGTSGRAVFPPELGSVQSFGVCEFRQGHDIP
jgi:hypothetical protein